MDKIIARQSSIVINDYTFGDCERLESSFLIWDQITHQSYLKIALYDEENKKFYVPRGLDLWYLEKKLNAKIKFDHDFDKFIELEPCIIKTLPRNDRQKEALRFLLAKGEYQWTGDYSQKLVSCNTGFGKTYITIAAITYMSIPAIVITGSVEWLNQWKEKTMEYTDIKSREICHIKGSNNIFRLLNNPNSISKYRIYLVTHATLQSYAETYGWDKVGEFFKAIKVGLKVYDEAHLNFDNISRIDYFTNTYITFYLTATPARSNNEENSLYRLYFKNVPKIDLFDEDQDPRTEYIAMFYNSHPTPKNIANCRNVYGLDRNKYTNYVVNQPAFRDMLKIIMYHIQKDITGKVLIYIGTNAAIQIVYDWIMENWPYFVGNVGIFTSTTDKSIKQEQLEKKIILSTTKSAGAAMDIKGLQETIVLAEPFKSEVLARQTLGRTRDRGTTYRELVDNGFYYTRNYYFAKQPIFDKYATQCFVEKYDDYTIEQTVQNIDKEMSTKRKPFIYLK